MSARKETRIVDKDEAEAFLQNMRWFDGVGPIRTKPLGNGQFAVTATTGAWSNWVPARPGG